MAEEYGIAADVEPAEVTAVSRRHVLTAGTGLLAGFGLAAVLPGVASAAPAAAGAQVAKTDLALFRPVQVSSTAYAATPAGFAVDGLAQVGVKGSGWRAADGDGQWIVVDLQGQCRIDSVVLTFEAQPGDAAFDAAGSRSHTSGFEILSSYAVSFDLDVSGDGKAWRTVHHTDAGTGGVVTIPLPAVTARWVRFSAASRSTTNPLGLNGFQVFGTGPQNRPAVHGWTSFPVRPHDDPPALAVAADGTVPLESGWVLTMDDWAPTADGKALSGSTVDTRGWLPATVPGTVLASLVEQGQLPDPVSGMNQLQVPEALSRHAWWYRRRFALPRGLDTSSGRHVWLEFDGVNHEARIWLNGAEIGTQSHPFGRGAFDVTAALRRSGDQALAVKIAPMPRPGSPGDKGADGSSWRDAGSTMFDNSPTYLAVSGWDWMPAVRDRASGIWDHVRLRSTGAAVLGDVRVDTVVPAADTAEVTLTVPVRNAAATAQRVKVSAAFGPVSVSATVTVPPGQTTDVAFPKQVVKNPKLWWPNGYGDPNLYDLTLTAAIGASTSDRRTVKIGLREIGYQYDLPIVIADGRATQTVDLAPQTARFVRMQGLKRATSWGFSLWTMAVLDGSGTDVAQGKAASSLSVADGNPPERAFDGDPNTRWTSAYDDNQWLQVDLGAATAFEKVVLTWETAYAATFKIQVSQDGDTWTDAASVDNSPKPLTFLVNGVKVFARGGSWGWDELLRRMPAERTDAVVGMHRDMNFTLLRNWVGSSYRQELFDACDKYGILLWNEFWDGWSTDPANHDVFLAQAKDTVLRYRHHACATVWFGCNEGTPPPVIDNALRDIVHDHTDLLYQGNSAGGVITGDGPYFWQDPKRYFTGEATGGKYGFWSEIGLPTVSVVESMRNLVGPDDPGWPIGAPWFLHDWSTGGNQSPQSYLAAIDARLAPSTSLAEFCRKAQFVNYENMRAIFEAWNTKLWADATGVLLWMSHPAWHSTVWQTYDYDLDVNGSYYGARKGCEARHVQADLTTWQIRVVNHTPAPLSGVTVTARLFSLAGASLGAAVQQKLDVAANVGAAAFTVPFDAAHPDLHLLRLTLTDAGGAVLSENTYWRYRSDAAMRALNQLPGARLTSSLKADGDAFTATIRNDGKTVAAMIRLSLRERNGTDRVLPTRYGDNYFWLLPGESRTVRVEPRRRVPGARLQVEAYNVAAKLTS
ncbi:Glycosyl hydrolases family 2, sugar binding domain [Amycolatopsis pretoriensis]|uniref:Glycosyl hydrolases family 2, sugar binding domain n=1 Tax=Amycolatopsis pretoriensis TaxID=218821 RepID=A0A1H5Q5R6_9PSEU|nr:discoidin domain-containing protein [Amycolatopsis pretoriensis]SEF21426.1 Glycosyl hydrolases family 2, sugar binding domain [Amycolatopsis pretoriensis]